MKGYRSNCLWITLISTGLLVDVKTFKLTNEKRTIRSANEHFPEFKSCSSYNPRIKEEQPVGTSVIMVQATDLDPPEAGGTITYDLGDSSNQAWFTINKYTGEITTKSKFSQGEPNRENKLRLTVRATDNGNPSLHEICSFVVTVIGADFQKITWIYKENVTRDQEINSVVVRIAAAYINDNLNKKVKYSFNGNGSDYDLFNIDPITGEVKLVKKISKPVGYVFKILAVASDESADETTSSMVGLEIKVIESKKHFLNLDSVLTGKYIELYENFTSITENIAILKSELDRAPVLTLVSGESEDTNSRGTFVLRTNGEDGTAYILLSGEAPLDYEVVKEYTLTIRFQSKHSCIITHTLKIKILDVNDNGPRFENPTISGQVFENERPGTFVMKVQAVDGDVTPEFKKITYELVGDSTDLFKIDPQSGDVTTKKELDREIEEFCFVKVIAKDGAPSAMLKNGEPNTAERVFRIDIVDKNDNSPKFEKDNYTVVVHDKTAVNSVVTELKATDVDSASQIVYSIVKGNEDGAFELVPGTGTGILKTNVTLDWTDESNYLLEVRASDGLYEAKCSVEIKVTNDFNRIRSRCRPRKGCRG